MPWHPNHHWVISSNTLYSRHKPSIFKNHPHLTRCKYRMNHPNNPHKWSLPFLRLPIHPRGPRNILWVIPFQRHLKHRSNYPTNNHNNSIHRIRSTLRTNIILRCNSNHKPPIRNSLSRKNTSTVSLRGILSSKPNTYPILCISLLIPLRISCYSSRTLNIPTPNRIK